jgi:hypothetical protein
LFLFFGHFNAAILDDEDGINQETRKPGTGSGFKNLPAFLLSLFTFMASWVPDCSSSSATIS